MKTLLYVASFVLLDAIVPKGCRPDEPVRQEPLENLPVTKAQILNDWNETIGEMLDPETGDTVPALTEYCLYDVDGNGRYEVLLRNLEANHTAFLCYDDSCDLILADFSSDTLQLQGVAENYYVRTHEEGTDDKYVLTSYYTHIEGSKIELQGYTERGCNGLNAVGDPSEYFNDETEGKVPDSIQVLYFNDIEEWWPFSVD